MRWFGSLFSGFPRLRPWSDDESRVVVGWFFSRRLSACRRRKCMFRAVRQRSLLRCSGRLTGSGAPMTPPTFGCRVRRRFA